MSHPSLPAVLPETRRRIVILTEDSKPNFGGIGEYLHQLALAASATHEVLIVTSVPGAERLNPGLAFRYREVAWFRPQQHRPGDRFMPTRRLNTLLWHLTRRGRVRSMLAAIHAEWPDSSYIVGRLSSVTFPWCAACRDLGLRYGAIAYGLELVEALAPRLDRKRSEWVSGASHWFGISRDTGDKLGRLGIRAEEWTLLLPGVAAPVEPPPSSEARHAVRDRLRIGEHPFILSLCYLRRRKGIDLAVEAFAAVASEFPDLVYVAAGSGPEEQALIAQARVLGLGGRIRFPGEIDEATKAVLFAECQFFLLPTRREAFDVEGFGIVYLEAGLHGKAVIGGANGGVPEAVVNGETGLLVDTQDATDLVAALRRLLRDPATARALGARGRSRACNEFAWSERGRLFADTVDVVLGARPGVPPPTPRTGPVVRIRRTLGTANNRFISGAIVLREVARQGRLGLYLAPRRPPADRAACAREMVAWVKRAIAAGGGEGASAGYHVSDGWAAAYPEITGYLITTLLHYGSDWDDRGLVDAAVSAGGWLARTRLRGGAICQKQWHPANVTPSVFNTAQVVEGWCALARWATQHQPETAGEWVVLARESADWLVREQEASGAWVRHAFNQIPHTYYARVAGPLARVADLTHDDRYAASARRALDWVLSQQTASGWFQGAGFTAHEAPTTHTIGYVVEGLLQGGRLLEDVRYVTAADRAADALLRAYRERGALPGRFAPEWRPRARWRCLTGDAQVAIAWCILSRETGNALYRRAAEEVADALRLSVRVTQAWPEMSGAVPGSSPPWGDYDPYRCPTHAAKFTLDLFALLGS